MAALAQDATSDGEAVVCDAAGVTDFELLHRWGGTAADVVIHALETAGRSTDN